MLSLVEEYCNRWTSWHSGVAGWPVAIDERCLAAKLFGSRPAVCLQCWTLPPNSGSPAQHSRLNTHITDPSACAAMTLVRLRFLHCAVPSLLTLFNLWVKHQQSLTHSPQVPVVLSQDLGSRTSLSSSDSPATRLTWFSPKNVKIYIALSRTRRLPFLGGLCSLALSASHNRRRCTDSRARRSLSADDGIRREEIVTETRLNRNAHL